MIRSLICYLCLITAVSSAMGQALTGKSTAELQLLLQHSKQDSNRILLLHALGNTYLKEEYSDKRNSLLDTAVGIFNHATRLSDTLQLKSLWVESKLLEGYAHLIKLETATGKKHFIEVASWYHTQGDVQNEARTWLWLARNLHCTGDCFTGIRAYYDKAIRLYIQAHNVEREAAARTSLADCLFTANKPDLAEQEVLKAIDLRLQTGSTKISLNYFLLSLINRYRGAYEKSLLYATKCIESAKQSTDSAYIAACYGEMGLVLDELARYEESSYWYRKCLTIRIALNIERVYLYKTAGLLIRQLIKLNKSKDALALMDSMVAANPPEARLEKAIAMQNLAYCYEGMKQDPKAEQYYNSMVAHFRNTHQNDEYSFVANMDIGRFYLKQGQFNKAHSFLDSALLFKGARLLDERDLYHMLFSADSALGNNTAAIKHLLQYQMINDSIYNERKSRQIEELTIQYKTEKKEQDIQILEKEARLQQNELLKAQATRRWILGVSLLLIILVGVLINHARLKQRSNRKLQAQQVQIEKKNESLQHLVNEKEWLVREIHHRVKNNFQIVMSLLRSQSAYLQGEEAIQAITESQQRIQAMSLVHQKLYQSDNLSAINMADYIHELTDCLKDSFHTGNNIQFNLQIDLIKLNIAHCIPLGLIINEAITNAIKHAFPDKREGSINIMLKRNGQHHFTLSIKDNGIGLPETAGIVTPSSMGMKLMRGLSEDLDTNLQVNNNQGTEIRIDFISEV